MDTSCLARLNSLDWTQATLAGVDFISITLPSSPTNETIDSALRQLEVSGSAQIWMEPVNPSCLVYKCWCTITTTQERQIRILLIDELEVSVISRILNRMVSLDVIRTVSSLIVTLCHRVANAAMH